MLGLWLALLSLWIVSVGLLYVGSRLALKVAPHKASLLGVPRKERQLAAADPPNVGRLIVTIVILLAFATVMLYGVRAVGETDWIRTAVAAAVLALAIGTASDHKLVWYLHSLVVLVAVSVVAAWFVYPVWLTTNLLIGLIIAGLLVVVQPRLSFRHIAVVGVAMALLYDIIQVFGTGAMVETAAVAVKNDLPMLLALPQLDASSWSAFLTAPPVFFLGGGDIFLPALLVVVAGRVAQRTSRPWVYRSGVIGFTVGLLVALLAATVLEVGQPATIYTIPAVVIAVLIAAYRGGVLRELAVVQPLHRTLPEQMQHRCTES